VCVCVYVCGSGKECALDVEAVGACVYVCLYMVYRNTDRQTVSAMACVNEAEICVNEAEVSINSRDAYALIYELKSQREPEYVHETQKCMHVRIQTDRQKDRQRMLYICSYI
jgi:hypothetical protein